MSKKLLVIKFGTASITKENGEPDEAIIARIGKEVAELHKEYHIVIVSSGAVGAGKHFIKNYSGEITQRKAAAAIGNPLLLQLYAKAFDQYGIKVAQSLCERQHFANRGQFLQLKETYTELWNNDIIPIANENDVVSNRELRFSDNDELATLIAAGFGASSLMLCTSSGGLRNKQNDLVTEIKTIDESIMALVDTSKSALGLGGMSSKLTFTKLATKMGIRVIIFGMAENQGILNAFQGKTGSLFLAQKANLSARDKWLASGSLTAGKVLVDAGAEKAIKNRKSLLAVGIISVEGSFQAGEVIEILTQNKEQLAIARVKVSSDEIESKPNQLVVHTDDMVMVG